MTEISRSTLEALEFPRLLEVLAELAATDVGAERVRSLAPTGERAELDTRRARYEEARVLLVDGPLVRGLEHPVRPLVERLADPRAVLDVGDVLQAADLLRQTESVVTRLRQADAAACPHLAAAVAELPDTREWTRQVGKVLDARGQIKDNASPALVKLRQQVRKLRDGLYSDLQSTVSRYGDHLSEETIPLHEGRLVLLLKSGARGQVDGLVHGKSGSGRSFYFEPLDAVEGNNRLRSAIDDEEAERARLVAELIDGLKRQTPSVQAAAELLADLDLLQAAARFAELAQARLPDIAAAGELRLCAARHPLLDPTLADLRQRALGHAGHREPMVPLDLELDTQLRLLVITGPNAGGKTVALKTAGLLTLAAQCGLPVPCAKGTRLPWVERLVATVGDEQDMLSERSTFSGRLQRLQEAWDAAGADSLVLLDELGSGTDPDEGAALAVALLEHLLASGALTIATTHLTRLAALALEAEGAACAAMEFDGAAGHPTYRLLPGSPGASEAIALARRLGLAAEWIERATAELDPEQRRLQRLLEELEATRRELAGQLDRAAREEQRLESARQETETERSALAEERKKVAQRLKRELNDFERRVRGKLRQAEEAMREEFQRGRRKGVAAKVAAEVLAEVPEALVAAVPEEAAGGELVIGGPVRHKGLGWEGRLEELNRGRATVNVRGKTMRCKEDELVALAAASAAAEPSRPKVSTPVRSRATPELQLIGQRVDDALVELDRYLDQAMLGERDELRVVHGHGSGRLRKAVRRHLANHPAVASHRAGEEGEGGNGATVVTLRG